MSTSIRPPVMLAAAMLGLACHPAGAKPDRSFSVAVEQPTYTSDGPVILYDEGHRNMHKSKWTYRPFTQLMANDGYHIERNRGAFSSEQLDGKDIVVIANARGANARNDDNAMTDAEAALLVDWIRRGGSLLLVTDHYPFGDAVSNLAAHLGVEMSRGVVEDAHSHESGFDASHIVFTRTGGGLGDHAINEGLGRVVTFTGQSLIGPTNAVPLLRLGSTAVKLAPKPREESQGGDTRVFVEYGDTASAAGEAQAIAFELGRGRVVVLGEAAMISAQLSRYDGSPFGMNVPGNDNKRFALQVMRWLSRART